MSVAAKAGQMQIFN